MEFVFVNDWYIYWFATVTMLIWTMFSVLILIGTAFIATIVYDIVKQVMVKWRKAK